MFQDLLAKLFDPNFATTAAQTMDPSALMGSLNLSTNLTMPEVTKPPGSFYELMNGRPLDPMAMGPGVAGTAVQKPFGMDAKNMAALQGMLPKQPDNTVRPPGSAGIPQMPRMPVSSLSLPEMARSGQRPSLSQLIYGR